MQHVLNFANELCKYFGKRDEEADKNDYFHWTFISPSLTLNCWAQLQELIRICQYVITFKSQKFNMDYNFHRTLLADANS